MKFFHRLALTAAYLTTLPFLHKAKKDTASTTDNSYSNEEKLSGLAKYFSCVGLIIGICLYSENWLLEKITIGLWLKAFILTVSWIIITGAIHLDGLMDTTDGLCAHQSRERTLEIMCDSRTGNFGALAGIFIVMGKWICLISLPAQTRAICLFITPAWARLSELVAISCFPYAKPQGMGKIWHDTTKYPRDLLLGSIVPLLATSIICFIIGKPQYLFIAVFVLASGWLTSYYINKRIGGQTGDTYGAVVEISELVTLALCAMLVP